MDFILTLDIGTTHVKALAFSISLEVLDEEALQIATYNPRENFQEQDPDEVLAACQYVVQIILGRLSARKLKAMVFSNAMHSIIPVDQKGNPLYPALIWSDLRASEITFNTSKTKNGKLLYAETGMPLHPMSPLFKILWFRQNEKKIFNEAFKFLSIKEYLLLSWFGEFLTDYSTASATGLFDINALEWSTRALTLAGITPAKLPVCTRIDHFINAGKSEFFKSLQVPADVPVIIGATDGCLAVWGGGYTDPKALSLTIGTSAAVRVAVSRPISDPLSRVFNYFLDENTFITGGPSNNGGNLLDWSGKLFLNITGRDSFSEQWASLIRKSSPGAEGIIFLPYVYGERAPIWQPNATGSFHGIKHSHMPEHFARSVIEGLLFNIRVIIEIISTDKSDKVILSGGAFKIKGFAQLASNIFDRPVKMLNHTNLSARGAAILGWKSLDQSPEESGIDSTEFFPNPQDSLIYSTHFIKFKTLLNTYQHQPEI